MDQIIITRFNYRFKESDPIEPLIDPKYWHNRLDLFKTFCFASVTSQLFNDFDWIIIIDQLLPDEYKSQLENLISEHYQSDSYPDRGPRKIYLHAWNYSDHLSRIDWVDRVRSTSLNTLSKNRYLITTRLDSDDALSKKFTGDLRKLAQNSKIKGFLIVSYAHGYTWNKSLNINIFKPSRQPLIALGLSLITDRTKFPLTIYCGRHTRLLTYLKTPSEHAIFKPLYEQNKELELNRAAQLALARKRYLIIRSGPPVYIRTIHQSNLQKNLRLVQRAPDLTSKIKQYFTLDWSNLLRLI